jgi:acyl-CoA synthetase (AMP-forming)/AMP-acid ligase II
MNIGSLLPRHARYRPDHPALVFDDERLSFARLDRRVNRLANALLAAGVGKGDKVATFLPNCLEVLELYWAVAKIGSVVVPLSPLLREEGLKSLLGASDSVMVLTNRALAETVDGVRTDLSAIAPERYLLVDGELPGYGALEAFVAGAPESQPPDAAIEGADPYNIIYSSGTTGEPKGIVHSHQVRANYCTLLASAFRMTPESVALHAGSVVFNGAFALLLPAMLVGATFVLHRQFDREAFIRTVSAEGVTHVMLVPSQIVALLESPRFTAQAAGSLEMLCTVGAPLHLEHKQRLSVLLPGRFYELYGLTEGFSTLLDKTDYEAKPGSVGVPTAFTEMRIVDDDGADVAPGEVGEIVGRGPLLMPGYYKRPDLTAEVIRHGWLHSGDLGRVDEDGFLYLVDRKKDMIISGGVNVYPKDIEEVVVRHPAVVEAAVFGVDDAKWGEAPVAAVLLNRPDAATADELREWINQRVGAKFQRVREVLLMDDFPRNVAGKTLKRVMRGAYAAK